MGAENLTRDRNAAFLLLDVTKEQVAAVPQISKILEKSGVAAKVWQYLEASDSPDVRKLLQARDTLNEYQQGILPIEAFCVAAGVSTKALLQIITGEVYEQSAVASRLLAAVNHADVVETTVISALSGGRGAQKDREMLLKHSGFLPVPKTSIVSVRGDHAVVGGQQNNIVAVLPPVESTIQRLSNRFAESMMIEAPPDPEIIDAEEVEYDEDDDDEE